MPQSSPPPLPGSKKGSSVLAWLGIGCGGILVIAFVVIMIAFVFFSRKAVEYTRKAEKNPAKAAAELFVRVNPDVELVSTDEQAGTMTIRSKETGKLATVTYADIAQGKFSVKSEDGEFRIEADPSGGGSANVTMKRSEDSFSYVTGPEAASKVPSWVNAAAYPGATASQAAFSVETAQGRSGSLGTTSKDDPQRVAQYYRDFLKREGYEISENSTTAETGRMTLLSARKESEAKTLVVVCTELQDGTQIFLSFKESEARGQP